MTPYARLRKARIAAGYRSATAAAQALGWAVPGYRHHENGTRSFDADQARVYAHAYKVSAAWLLMLSEETKPNPFSWYGSQVHALEQAPNWFAELTQVLEVKLGMVLLAEVAIGQSFVVFEDSEEEYASAFHAFERAILEPVAKMGNKWLYVIRVEGDDMSPTAKDGALVVIDTAQKEVTQQDQVWAFQYAGMGFLRRIRSHPDGTLECLADATTVKSLRAQASEVEVFGRAVWVSQRP